MPLPQPGRRALLLGMTATGFALAAQAAAATYLFDLPAQALPVSLRAVASLTAANLLFDPAVVGTRNAPALKGRLTLDDALRRLLTGSGLAARRGGSGALLIEASDHE